VKFGGIEQGIPTNILHFIINCNAGFVQWGRKS